MASALVSSVCRRPRSEEHERADRPVRIRKPPARRTAFDTACRLALPTPCRSRPPCAGLSRSPCSTLSPECRSYDTIWATWSGVTTSSTMPPCRPGFGPFSFSSSGSCHRPVHRRWNSPLRWAMAVRCAPRRVLLEVGCRPSFCFSACHFEVSVDSSSRPASSSRDGRAGLHAPSFSTSASRSIWSCMMRRSSSSASGFDRPAFWPRRCLVYRSIALSGRKRSAMRLDSVAATRAESEMRTLWCCSYFSFRPRRSKPCPPRSAHRRTPAGSGGRAASFSTCFLYRRA